VSCNSKFWCIFRSRLTDLCASNKRKEKTSIASCNSKLFTAISEMNKRIKKTYLQVFSPKKLSPWGRAGHTTQVARLSSCSPSKLSPWALAWRRDEGAQILNLVKIGRGRAREEERMHLVDLLARHPTRSSQGHSGGWLSRTRVTRRGDGLNYYLIASSISYYTQYFEILNNAETRKLIFLKIKIK